MRNIKEILNNGSYSSKLADNRWRDFARGIRKDRNCCECCRQSGKVLQVHHLFYESSREPWEYEDNEILVLCESCHKQLHAKLQNFRKFVFRYLTPNLFQILNGCLAVGLTEYDPLVYMHALKEFTSNGPLIRAHAKAKP